MSNYFIDHFAIEFCRTNRYLERRLPFSCRSASVSFDHRRLVQLLIIPNAGSSGAQDTFDRSSSFFLVVIGSGSEKRLADLRRTTVFFG